MENEIASKVKKEPQDEDEAVTSAFTSSNQLMEYFLDNEFKKEDCDYNSQVKFLDEVDGKFRQFSDISSSCIKPSLEGDLKNYCNKCSKAFNNLSAAQNHYIFTHPDPSFLPVVALQTSRAVKKRNYNWLNEPVQIKASKKTKESSNIIIIKDKGEYLKKLSNTTQLVKLTENASRFSDDVKSYTLEAIKSHPQAGIRIVRKSDIHFDELQLLAEKKLMLTKKLEPQITEALPKKSTETSRQLLNIDIETALRKQAKVAHRNFVNILQKPQKAAVRYLCKRCNLLMCDPHVFDCHIRKHTFKANFGCRLCNKTFCTMIGILNHTCKNYITYNGVKMVRLSSKKEI